MPIRFSDHSWSLAGDVEDEAEAVAEIDVGGRRLRRRCMNASHRSFETASFASCMSVSWASRRFVLDPTDRGDESDDFDRTSRGGVGADAGIDGDDSLDRFGDS